ncbi:MAG: hypothetical protein KY429_01985 [Actinobacteria bacterium]|nr:hypothetical protein [Actinomycetota bacterium]
MSGRLFSAKLWVPILLASLVTATTGCARAARPEQKVNRYLNNLLEESRIYTYEEVPEDGPELLVRVRWEDDLRYYEKLAVEGADAAEIVVSEDALALRVIDPPRIPAFQGGAPNVAGSQVIGQELMSGKWVLDYQAAPPTSPPRTDTGAIIVGQDPFLDASYVFDYLIEAVRSASLVWEFNPEDLTVYRKSEDPFPPPNENLGEKRIDAFPQPLPGRGARGTEAAVARTANFRRIAFYIRGEQIVRVREQITVEQNPQILRAQRGGGAEHHLQILEQHRAGELPEPIRVREMTIEIEEAGEDVESVSLPQDTVLAADMSGVLGSLGFATTETGQGSGLPPGFPASGEGAPPEEEGSPMPEEGGEAQTEETSTVP